MKCRKQNSGVFFSGPDPTARHSCLPLRSATHNYVTAKTLASHRPVSAARVRVGRCHGKKKKKKITLPYPTLLFWCFYFFYSSSPFLFLLQVLNTCLLTSFIFCLCDNLSCGLPPPFFLLQKKTLSALRPALVKRANNLVTFF